MGRGSGAATTVATGLEAQSMAARHAGLSWLNSDSSVVPTGLILWSGRGHVSPLASLILVYFPNQYSSFP